MKKIGFIGLGIMGSRMATNLQKEGHNLYLYNRTKSKADFLVSKGGSWKTSPAEAAKEASILITMLSTPEVVAATASGAEGFLNALKPGSIWLNCSTINPSAAVKMEQLASQKGIRYIDAPVAGTKAPAEKGELLFLVGGEEEVVSEVQPLLDIMGKKTIHLGVTGNGSKMKMLINLLLAQSMLAFGEAMALGKGMGLSESLLFNVLCNTPVIAPFIGLLRPKLEQNDQDANFPLKWIQKDIHLATTTAYEIGVPMPSLNTAKEVYAQAKQYGLGDNDFSAIYTYLQGTSE